MGTWAEDTFGNDTACDWINEFLEKPGFKAVIKALNAVLDEKEYLDSDIACEALAACEVIARLKGNWGLRNAYSEELDSWIEENPQQVSPELIVKARTAIDKIMGKNSELPELWDANGKNDVWHSEIEGLKKRIES